MRTLLVITMTMAANLCADDGESKKCTDATIKGTYGYTITGARPVPAGSNAGQIEQHIGAGVRSYDGQGNFTQVDTTKGSITGVVADVSTSGTYSVKPDCSGVAFVNVPSLPLPVETRFVVVNKGKEISWIVVNAVPTVMISGRAVRQ
jgi:hypothetical protein